MSEEDSPLQRILVALDASPHSRAALDAAVRLAATFEGKIEGLFIEDETLLRTAQLPFAKEVRAHTAPPKRLNDERMQRQLRYQAEYAEYALQQAAEEADVTYAFRTTQGDVIQELMRAAAEVDLLVLGKTSTASSRRRLGTTSRTLLSDAPSPVLVLRNTMSVRQPLLVYYDGSEEAETALAFAMQLSRRGEGAPVDVLLPAHDEADPNQLRDQLRRHPPHSDVPIRTHSLSRPEIHRLSAFVRQNGGLVILPSGCPPLCSTSLQQFLYEIDRPLLVVR